MVTRVTGPGAGEDPKVTALRESRCLNPHPEQVRDGAFLAEEFFDARDAAQVKYEMVRRVQTDGESITAAAAAFGYSRPSYYQAAAALAESGLDGLVATKPGPRRVTSSPRRSSPGPRISWRPIPTCGRPPSSSRSPPSSGCACTPARSNARWPATGSAPKAAAATQPGPPLDADPLTADGGLDTRYEQLRHAALHARAEAFPLGLGVLRRGGVTAWRHALTSLTHHATATSTPPALAHAPLPAAVTTELIDALAGVALAVTIPNPAPSTLSPTPAPGDPHRCSPIPRHRR
ncbi:MAG: helix-turn-helix domain-containing protein [Pseudonocardiaceae bacterium]